AGGPLEPDMARALAERRQLIEARSRALAAGAIREDERRTRRRRRPPAPGAHRDRWVKELETVAAFRDRHMIVSDSPLGAPCAESQPLDRARAVQAIRRARAIASTEDESLIRGAHAEHLGRA